MPGEITELLQQWKAGTADQALQARLVPLVYDHLRQVARSYVAREYGGGRDEIGATGLVHELFLRLMEIKSVSLEDRGHFYAFSARMMRNILVDEARKRSASKRGGSERVPLGPDLAWVDASSAEMIDLNAAIEELLIAMPEHAAAVELRVFLGCTSEEAAALLGVGKATVDRHMRFARAWLYERLRGTATPLQTTLGDSPPRP
jgi:RNA polymerase sigma factor (TIGR02999 family)